MARSSEIQRRLDHLIGPVILRTIAILRGGRPRPATIRRIGFLEPTAIGDLVLDTPMLAAARRRYPDAELHLFHGASNAALVPLLPAGVIAHRCDFRTPWKTLTILRAANLDILVDCTSWPRLTAILAALCGAHTIGFSTPGQSRHYAQDDCVSHHLDRHESLNRAALAGAIIGEKTNESAMLAVPPAKLPDLPFQRLILCHVSPGGSRAREKSWLPDRWAELARLLARDGWILGFTGVRQDEDAIQTILNLSGLSGDVAFSLAGRLDMAQLAQLFGQARLLITVDTATVHLGSALSVPMIALHGPSPSRRWGATSARAISIDAPHPAAGFIHFGYETHPQAMDIMSTIAVTDVYEQARRQLRGTDRPA